MQSTLFPDAQVSGAHISGDGDYRYALWRTWASAAPVVFILLNPSTADAAQDDPTLRRCIAYARAHQAGGLRVVNLFALRATDPGALYVAADPVGVNNDCAILEATRDAKMVIVGWGQHGAHLGRAQRVLTLLEAQGIRLHALRINKDGSPSHPLYLPGNLQPEPYTGGNFGH